MKIFSRLIIRELKNVVSLQRIIIIYMSNMITVPRTKRLSSYERSLRDLDEGRVYEYDSLDDLIKEIEG